MNPVDKLYGLIWGEITHRFVNVPMGLKEHKEFSDSIYNRIEEHIKKAGEEGFKLGSALVEAIKSDDAINEAIKEARIDELKDFAKYVDASNPLHILLINRLKELRNIRNEYK